MARLINADAMKNNIMEAMMRQFEKNGDQLALRIAEMMWHFIDVTDTVDAVPVVRCKDCKFIHDKGFCTRVAGLTRIKPDDFCSYGERKE